MYEDKTLICKECGNEFVFTAGEQEFYKSSHEGVGRPHGAEESEEECAYGAL